MNADTRSSAAWHPNAGSENCLPIGTRLSDFEITGVLGEGGFGIVYVAYDRALQRTVAIKEYMPGVLATRSSSGGVALRAERHRETFGLGLKSFINEARLLAQFDHPALIKVYRFWEHNRTAYMAMKFYDGRTIKDIVTNSPELVDEAWCRKVLGQILQALDTLYTRQILHRDISPDNIIIQDNGDAVLLDFGSARQIIGDMTRGLTVILKPGFAPVEQYAGDASLEQGPYTDLYALSAVMYFAITKTPPPASIGRMIQDPIVALAAQAPAGYGAQLLAAIDKGLAVLARERPQTIAEFRAQLGMAAERRLERVPERVPAGLPPARPAAAVPPTMAEQAHDQAVHTPPAPGRIAALLADRRRLLIGAGAASLLAIVAAGLAALVQPSSEDTFVLAQPQASETRAGSAGVTAAAAPGADPASAVSAESAAAGVASPLPVGTGVGVDAAAGAGSTSALSAGESVIALPAAAAVVAEAPAADTGVIAPAGPDAKLSAALPGASYKLRIMPWGTLYVDGVARGVSPPLKQVMLSPGKHDIRIVNPSFPDYVAAIVVDKNKPGTIELDFAAR